MVSAFYKRPGLKYINFICCLKYMGNFFLSISLNQRNLVESFLKIANVTPPTLPLTTLPYEISLLNLSTQLMSDGE